MDAIDRALEESLRRQKASNAVGADGASAASNETSSVASVPGPAVGSGFATHAATRSSASAAAPDPFSPEAALLRAESEDDDGYDPYSDYMDQLARGSSYDDELEEDPWR